MEQRSFERKAPRLGLAFASVATAVVLSGSGPSTQTGERFSLSGPDVAIYNLAGELRVEPGSGSAVVVEITRGGRDAGALRVETGRREGVQTLRVIYPGKRLIYPPMGRSKSTVEVAEDGTFDDDHEGFLSGRRRVTIQGSGAGAEAHADLRVLVPPGQKLRLHGAVGRTRVSRVEGSLALHQGSGPIETEGTRGTLTIDSGSGSVRVTRAQGDLTLDTGSGDVTVEGVRGERLKLDSGSGGVRVSEVQVDELRADTGSGGVELEGVRASEIALDTGSGEVRLDLQSDVRSLDVDSGSGDVTIEMPSGLGAEFDIETGSGPIEVDVAHEAFQIERDRIRGRIGDGRGRIRIETGSGSVRLQRRSVMGARSYFGFGMWVATLVE